MDQVVVLARSGLARPDPQACQSGLVPQVVRPDPKGQCEIRLEDQMVQGRLKNGKK